MTYLKLKFEYKALFLHTSFTCWDSPLRAESSCRHFGPWIFFSSKLVFDWKQKTATHKRVNKADHHNLITCPGCRVLWTHLSPILSTKEEIHKCYSVFWTILPLACPQGISQAGLVLPTLVGPDKNCSFFNMITDSKYVVALPPSLCQPDGSGCSVTWGPETSPSSAERPIPWKGKVWCKSIFALLSSINRHLWVGYWSIQRTKYKWQTKII